MGIELESLPQDYKDVAIDRYREDFDRSLEAVQQSFFEFNFPDVGSEECFQKV